MDCQTFDASLIDALYGELDSEAAEVMDAHAKGCPACAARLRGLDATRRLVGPLLETDIPDGLEARILAATDKRGRPGGVLRFLARPQLAMAASFVLVAGAAVYLMTNSRTSEAPTATRSAERADEPASQPASAPASASPAPIAAPIGATDTAPSASKTADDEDPALAEAKRLYAAGNCKDALPRLEAIAETTPAAELYVARCVAKTKSCAEAVAHFDSAARRNLGTETGSRAALEAARCLKAENQSARARARYTSLTTDGFVADEATNDLATLDAQLHNVAKPAATTRASATATSTSPIDNAYHRGR